MKIICPHCNFENKIFENPQLKECLKCKKDIRTNNLNVPERLIMFIFVVGGAIIIYNSICISLSLLSEYKNKYSPKVKKQFLSIMTSIFLMLVLFSSDKKDRLVSILVAAVLPYLMTKLMTLAFAYLFPLYVKTAAYRKHLAAKTIDKGFGFYMGRILLISFVILFVLYSNIMENITINSIPYEVVRFSLGIVLLILLILPLFTLSSKWLLNYLQKNESK